MQKFFRDRLEVACWYNVRRRYSTRVIPVVIVYKVTIRNPKLNSGIDQF